MLLGSFSIKIMQPMTNDIGPILFSQISSWVFNQKCLHHRGEGTDYDQRTTMTSSSNAHCPLGLAAAVSACADHQFASNFHRICEAQTLWNNLKVGLRAGYLSVRTVGGATRIDGD